MLKNIIICSTSKTETNILKDNFTNSIFDFKYMTISEYMESSLFDIKNFPTSFLENFNSQPLDIESQVVNADLKFGRSYIVTSPNFIKTKNLTQAEKSYYQITAPLKEAILFSNVKDLEFTYGIHSEFSFCYLKVTLNTIQQIKNSFEEILAQYNF